MGNLFNDLQDKIKDRKVNNILVVCLIMAFLLIAVNVILPSFSDLGFKKNNKTSINTAKENSSNAAYESEKDFEEKQKADLKNILKKIDGVGDVDVMITFESDERKQPAYDETSQVSKTEESDTAGGKRVNNVNSDGSTVVMTNKDGSNEPFIITTYKPKVVGVIVVAEGAEDSRIKYDIEMAVSKIYDLSLDKVNVYTMKN